MIANSDIHKYLQLIIDRYENWWTVDALTETIEARQATFSFSQVAQTEEVCKEVPDRKKKVPVLLPREVHKYTEEHVLLVGSPGIGKSTVLLRLLVDFARQELEEPIPRIPVLVQLRRYKKPASRAEDRSGMLALIQDALEPELFLEISEIKNLLFQEKRLILLLDGLNEMPADMAVTELTEFRDKCDRAKIPLICTTRESGDKLGIKRRLDIQPLTPQGEIRRFLDECMSSKKQEVLHLLDREKQELSCTPFVLWMLYDSFQQTGNVAGTMGEAFQQFFQSFTDRKEASPVKADRRRQWDSWLEHLAFSMLNSPDPLDPGLVILEEQAEKVLTEKFGAESPSRINELEKYHLLQEISHKQIGFHHQLIQEYYAAEGLLHNLRQHPERLEKLPGQEYTRFQCEYLNLQKWTEPIALMLGLADEAQALRVVELAIGVDLMLGARSAGEVRVEFQEPTLSSLSILKIPALLKIQLLGNTHSDSAIFLLNSYLADQKSDVRSATVTALGQVGSQEAASCLLKILESEDPMVYGLAAYWLAKIGNRQAVDALLKALNHKNSNFRQQAAEALGEINHEDVISALCEALNDDKVCLYAGLSLKRISSWVARSIPCQDLVDEVLVKYQTQLSKAVDSKLFSNVNKTTEKIDKEVSIPTLLQELEHEDMSSYTRASIELQRIGTPELISQLYIFLRINKAIRPLHLRHILETVSNIQSRCKFYNYEIFQAAKAIAPISNSDYPQEVLARIDQRTKQMSEEPKRIIHTQNYFEKGNHDHIHNYSSSDEALKQQVTELRQMVTQLQKTYQPANEAEATKIIDVEFRTIQKTNPTRWQIIQTQLQFLKHQILNPESHLKATKATVAEIAKHYLEESVVSKALITYIDTLSAEAEQGE